jgi:hypothetical protein
MSGSMRKWRRGEPRWRRRDGRLLGRMFVQCLQHENVRKDVCVYVRVCERKEGMGERCGTIAACRLVVMAV